MGIIFSSALHSSEIQLPTFSSFQVVGCKFSLPGNKYINFFSLYRPPNYPSRFLDEIQDFLAEVVVLTGEIIITGDFNIHLDQPELAASSNFLDTLTSFSLIQHVNFFTHIKEHWLDLIITHGKV